MEKNKQFYSVNTNHLYLCTLVQNENDVKRFSVLERKCRSSNENLHKTLEIL